MRFVLFSIFLFFAVAVLGQAAVQGYVHDELTKAPLKGTKITLLVLDSVTFNPERFDSFALAERNYDTRYDTAYKSLKTTTTDTNGYYFFDTIPAGIYELEVFHVTKQIRPNIDEGEFAIKHGIKLNSSCNDMFSFVLHVTCEFDLTKNLAYCPKCRKKDKILPIMYGYPLPTELQDPGFFYNGFCVKPRCRPAKHCSRCYFDF